MFGSERTTDLMLPKIFRKDYCIRPTSRSSTFFTVVMLVLSAIILAGCVPTLFRSAKTTDETTKPKKQESTLIKPRLSQQPAEPEQSPSNNKQNSQNETRSDDKSTNKSHDESNSLDVSTAGRNESLTNSKSESLDNKEKAPRRLIGVEKGKVPPESEQIKGDKPSDVKTVAPDDADWMLSDERKPKFKKHDHSKYVKRIKTLAMEALNKEFDPFYATLCSDSTTDEWSLTIYFKKADSFRYKSLIWDPIDDKWEQQYESGNKPLAGWKKHVSFVSADKRCSQLKVGDRN
ncbi:MAG: hypothetical protein ACYDHG_00765 [Desulfomonilaceae bacterium]